VLMVVHVAVLFQFSFLARVVEFVDNLVQHMCRRGVGRVSFLFNSFLSAPPSCVFTSATLRDESTC
jgi:Rad3-related DNA helicase